jgi:Concanavalin A-like lectin/glucanases superfamily
VKLTLLVAAALLAWPSTAAAQDYPSTVLGTPGLTAYWRLDDPSGTVAADAKGQAAGAYLGGPALGAPGAVEPGSSVRFDGADDEMQASATGTVGTVEGWFLWEAGVALMRDATGGGGWIVAFDSGGRLAYRVGGTTFTTSVATANVRGGWHHLALTVAAGTTTLYLDGTAVHGGAGAGATAPAMPWHVMRNGTTTQYARGRADEIAVYDSVLSAATIRARFDAGREAVLLRAYSPVLRYEAQETYFADSAAELTDNHVPGSRQNYLVSGSGTRLAAANPADPLANLSLAFLGDPNYADGRAATTSDYLDAANASYQQDAQRMRAAGYGDRVYGRVATSAGKTWLQYWQFSYYNPQNVFGFGVHEGDWEFIQVGLDAAGAPDVATYAQHGGGERCSWGQVQKSAGAPVVYVALASHASYFSTGINPRGFLPDDYHRGGGYQVRPALEIVTQSTPFMAWRGKWGASSSSPAAPRRQSKWGDPNGFSSSASACTVGGTQAAATANALRAGAEVAEPEIQTRRRGTTAAVRYRVDEPATVLLSVARAGAPDDAVARRVRGRSGTAVLRLPPGGGPYVVSASAFSKRGARSGIVRAPLR